MKNDAIEVMPEIKAAVLKDLVATMTKETKGDVLCTINKAVNDVMGYVVPVYTAYLVGGYAVDGLDIRKATRKELGAYLDTIDKAIEDKNGHMQGWHKTRVIIAVEKLQRQAEQCAAFVKALPEGERNALATTLKSNDTTLEVLAQMVPDKALCAKALGAANALASVTVPASKPVNSRGAKTKEEKAGKEEKAPKAGPLAEAARIVANDGLLSRSASKSARRLLEAFPDDGALLDALAFIFQDGAIDRATLQAARKASK